MSKIGRIVALLGLVALAFGGATACGSSGSSESSASAQAQPSRLHEPMTEEDFQLARKAYDMGVPTGWIGAVVFDENGKYVVGRDIHPGDYQTVNPAEGCHWELLATDGSKVTDSTVLAKQVPGSAQQASGLATGQTFSTENCGKWVFVP